MTKAWQSVVDIRDCAVAVYSAAGVALTAQEITDAGIVITQNADGTISVTSNVGATLFYVRLTPNFGTGMGSAEARIGILSAANVNSDAPRWDAGGTWDSFNGAIDLAQPETGDWSYIEVPVNPDGLLAPTVEFVVQAYFDINATIGYNCSCGGDDGVQYRTLLEMRQEMLIGLGRGNQLANPGPGVAALVDMHLRQAQNLLYNRASWLVMDRYFSWPLLAGVRLYGLRQNGEDCAKRINPNKVSWVGIVRDSIYLPLRQGIWPTLHSYDTLTGYPQRFEIRQCIEIWPAPDITEGALVIKGNFGLLPLVADEDVASIDDSLICLLALGTLKRHFRQPDALDYVQMGEVMLLNLVAGTHTGMARYIPGRRYNGELVWNEPLADPPFPGGP